MAIFSLKFLYVQMMLLFSLVCFEKEFFVLRHLDFSNLVKCEAER